jgi:YHS domain-containing protein
MNKEESKSLPMVSSGVFTACGTEDKFMDSTPRVFHEGKWYFFCTPACQEEFVQDPQNSCLTSHHISSDT